MCILSEGGGCEKSLIKRSIHQLCEPLIGFDEFLVFKLVHNSTFTAFYQVKSQIEFTSDTCRVQALISLPDT